MTIQKVNIGSVVNDGTGDDLRTAFVKANNNFDELANTKRITDLNDLIVKSMNDTLSNYDFGTFSGSTAANTGILQLILQSLDMEFGTIISPGKYYLDLGSIASSLDGGAA